MDKLQYYQQVEWEILKEFRRVCEELGLRYYLTAGTLLGAIRHRGFIPWDDDIDVAMPREDYDRFAREGAAKLAETYCYQSHMTEPNFPYYFAKIRKQGTFFEEPILRSVRMEQGIYIDIFPLDKCPENAWIARCFFRWIAFLNNVILGKVSKEFRCGYRKWYAKGAWKLLQRLPAKQIFGSRELVRDIAGWCSSGICLCTVGGRHGFPREAYQADWFSESVLVEFEGENFPAPKDWDKLLRNMYGDYMVLPNEADRQGHFIRDNSEKGEDQR